MRHGVKKIKIKQGVDANKALVHTYVRNFFLSGKITVTHKRAKIVKPIIERLVGRAKDKNETNRYYLMKKIYDKQIVARLFDEIAPVFKGTIGGCVRLIKLGSRMTDGAEMTKVEWSKPLVKNGEEKKPVIKTEVKKDVQSNV